MNITQKKEMEMVIRHIVSKVRDKAKEFSFNEGVVAICCTNRRRSDGAGKCFGEIWPDEDSIRIFSLKGNLSFTESLRFGHDDFNHFGTVATKIAVAAKVYYTSKGHEFMSRSLNFPMGYDGCVVYPLRNDRRQICGLMYVSVSGGTDAQNEACAWEAFGPITEELTFFETTNPGPSIGSEEKNI